MYIYNRIQETEDLNRRITNALITALFTASTISNLTITPMPTTCHIDDTVEFENNGKKRTYFVETKLRSVIKNSYDYAALKTQKYDYIRDYYEANSATTNDKLIYIAYADDGNAYIYDLTGVKMDETYEVRQFPLKKTEMDDNSKIEMTPTYILPFSAATATYEWKNLNY